MQPMWVTSKGAKFKNITVKVCSDDPRMARLGYQMTQTPQHYTTDRDIEMCAGDAYLRATRWWGRSSMCFMCYSQPIARGPLDEPFGQQQLLSNRNRWARTLE